VRQGISLGCPLSPLIAALYLKSLDQRLEATGLFCAPFMDDWVVLAPSRWKLRRAARIMQQTLAESKLRTHPDKTFLVQTQNRVCAAGIECVK
jgi:RNA-directed DNA polymerase